MYRFEILIEGKKAGKIIGMKNSNDSNWGVKEKSGEWTKTRDFVICFVWMENTEKDKRKKTCKKLWENEWIFYSGVMAAGKGLWRNYMIKFLVFLLKGWTEDKGTRKGKLAEMKSERIEMKKIIHEFKEREQ